MKKNKKRESVFLKSLSILEKLNFEFEDDNDSKTGDRILHFSKDVSEDFTLTLTTHIADDKVYSETGTLFIWDEHDSYNDKQIELNNIRSINDITTFLRLIQKDENSTTGLE